MKKSLTVKQPVNSLNEKRVARAAFHALHTWRSSFPQDIHKLILTVGVEMERINKTVARKYIELVACSIRIGHFAGMNGRSEFRAQPAEWFSKRWRCVSKKAVRVGISFACPEPPPATSVPK